MRGYCLPLDTELECICITNAGNYLTGALSGKCDKIVQLTKRKFYAHQTRALEMLENRRKSKYIVTIQ